MPSADPSPHSPALIPLGQVRLLDPPDIWQCPDDVVSFRIVGPFRAGHIRVRFSFRCEVPLILQIVTDDPVPRVLDRSPPTCRLVRKLLLRLDKPAAALRIEIIGPAPQFILSDVHFQPISAPSALLDALFGKLTQLRQYGGTWSALGRGLRLLLQGRVHTFFAKLTSSRGRPSFVAGDECDVQQTYAAWRQQRLMQPRPQIINENDKHAPMISVLVMETAAIEGLLDATLASLGRQFYHKWEILEVRSTMTDQVDVAAANAALARARGEFLLFLDAGDEIPDYALHALAQALMADPTLDMLTTDEDQVDAAGRHGNPHFKPGFSPETLLSQPNLGSCALFRTALVREVGCLRPECANLAVYDLMLRVIVRTSRIQHLADILFHRRQTKRQPDAADFTALTHALTHHLAETARPGVVEPTARPPGFRVRFHILGQPLISILIPTAFGRQTGMRRPLIVDCLASIRTATTWTNYEIILLSSGDPAPVAVAEELARHRAKIVALQPPFNFAAAINAAAAQAEGSQLLLLNDDTEVITPDWLQSMLEYAQQPDIGAVGARLLFPHGRVQHTGLHLLDGKPMHAFYGYPADHAGYHDSMNTPRNYLAVTGACLMTRREVFQELGGLDVGFAIDCNDIDYCLRIIQTGRRVVCTPYAQLLHYEAVTRCGMEVEAYADFKARWADALGDDPYYNPNFKRLDANYKSLRVLH